MRSSRSRIVALIISAGLSASAVAQRYDVGTGASVQPAGVPSIIQGIKIDQNLSAQVPLELTFKDDTGRTVRLGQYFGETPVVLALVYYDCPGLCDLVLNGLEDSMQKTTLTLGTDFQVVTVSFNPQETWQLAAAKKANYVQKLKNPAQGREAWHFLTGQDDQIVPLAKAVGFHYRYDPSTKLYAHASGIMVLTPEGKVARYLYGIQYNPRDLRLGLVEAADHKIGSPVDEVLLFCYHYDPSKGKYGLVIANVLRIAGSVTVFGLLALVFVMMRRDRRSRHVDVTPA